ncbi:uncharacterized protein LOC115980890 [Quercus lobata]|uniref:uncharacterized protein LOC115980890 n=1 Tax=Quercus lobata TaxID=97700 RepID=UPI0012489226|nr:uncharacterized protein LOC115980890 [Quercus lobata]
MNTELLRVFTRQEVEVALKQMAPLKAPGLDESQSAFQSDKAISDNILVAFETLYRMKMKKLGKEGYMAMKLDMSKAYDRVEWIFLESLMFKLGFHEKWVGMVISTVKTISYSILVNGEPQGNIQPTRGIRQGDPLYPYLFMLCSEGPNGLLQKSVAAGDLRGFSLCKYVLQISYLFFADDSLIFCRAKMGDVQTIQAILSMYEKALGQKVNGLKTNLFFGKSVSDNTKNALKDFLGVPKIKEYEKYLGLSAICGKRRKIHWKKWETLYLSKSEGGMNFKELSKFNEAMLAKQVWRLIHDKESLFYRVFRAKFFPLGDIFSAQVKSGSYAWRSILSARKVVAARARWRICNGLTTRIYSDCWLRGAASGKISSQISDIPANAVVADLFEENSGWWNGVLIDQYFSPFEAQKIKSIPVCITPQEDILIWPKTRDGKYSVKTGYQLLREMENSELASSLDSGENKKFWTGIGVVVRNSLGEVLAALSEIIPLPLSIVVLETIAARRAVTFLQELGLGQFYL